VIGVREGPVEGGREEEGKTQFVLIVQQVIARISKIPHSSPYV